MSCFSLLRWQAGGGLAIVALFSAGAATASGQFELEWSGPRGCPGSDWVRAEVTRILHRPVPDETDLKVRCVIEPLESGRFRMNVETHEGSHVGKRSMEADTCSELASSAAVLVAILIDPNAAARKEPTERPTAAWAPSIAPSPSSASTPSTSPAATPTSTSTSTSTPTPTPTSTSTPTPTPSVDAPVQANRARSATATLQYDAGLTTGALIGILPSAAPGLGLELGLEVPVMRFEVGGVAWLSTRATVDPGATQGADFQLLSFYGRACAHFSAQRWSGGPCAGGELEVLQGTGFGPGVTPNPNGATFGSGLAGAAMRWTASRDIAVPARLEAVVPVSRPSFVFSGTDGTLVHQPARVGARFTLGIEYRFR